jgi:hypothetical protein
MFKICGSGGVIHARSKDLKEWTKLPIFDKAA